mgnify:CR=1 FL=1
MAMERMDAGTRLQDWVSISQVNVAFEASTGKWFAAWVRAQPSSSSFGCCRLGAAEAAFLRVQITGMSLKG